MRLAANDHLIREHVAFRCGKRNRAQLLAEAHKDAARLEQPEIVASGPRRHCRLAAQQIVLRAITGGDVVFGDHNDHFGIGLGLPDHFRFAFSKDDAVKERLHNSEL